jgi:predicted GNAT family N-acyltransferase
MAFLVRFASTSEDRDAAFLLRRAVFEQEQNIPRPLDRDAHDSSADHVVAFDGERCVGTGRIVRLDQRTCQVGRQATAPSHRGQGVGAAVLEHLERMARLRGVAELKVHAQLPAEPFYRNRGFVREGEVFQDQGVPHVLMRKRLLP